MSLRWKDDSEGKWTDHACVQIVQGVVGEVESRLTHLQSEADDEKTRSLRPDTRSLYLVKKERIEHGRRVLAHAVQAHEPIEAYTK